jgi:DUF218 domain
VSKKHDRLLAVVIGTRFSENWGLRQDLKDLLDHTWFLYDSGAINKILVCGKWTIWYDWLSIVPPTTEAQLMKSYLIKRGVSPRDIVKETRSKDTIGNIYYLDKYLRGVHKYDKVLILCATQRLRRIKYIINKIMRSGVLVYYDTVDAPNDSSSSLGSENDLIIVQKRLLEKLGGVIPYDFKHGLYADSYYTDQKRKIDTGQIKNTYL